MDGDAAGEDVEMPRFTTFPTLAAYLRSIKTFVLHANQRTTKDVTVVIGNPSCDLDSFVSATILSYFCNVKARPGDTKLYVPVLNMPKTLSGELWRLRPEFGKALRLATEPSEDTSTNEEDVERGLLDTTITIKDILNADNAMSSLKAAFYPSSKETDTKQELLLVDHNTPSFLYLADSAITSRFQISGVIDHHIDDQTVPPEVSPRIVKTGIGSCTSLVVDHLRSTGVWPDSSSLDEQENTAVVQIAKLAEAAITEDTSNLTASAQKCSQLDKDIIRLLDSQIVDSELHATSTAWDRTSFYQTVDTAKKYSLENLKLNEIFDRDYKEWTDSTQVGETVTTGVSSIMKNIDWLIKKPAAKDDDSFVRAMEDFATSDDTNLGVFAFLCRPREDGKGKEVGVITLREASSGVVAKFAESATDTLGLKDWDDDKSTLRAMKRNFGTRGERWQIWYMTNLDNTRKQVAPALRDAVKSV